MRLVDHLQRQTGKGEGSVSLTTERPSPIQLVSVGSSGKALPQLGFGCSYLLGPGLDRAKSLRLLETAYDAGIRYFDTARLYGQGKGEALLGEFLRHHSDVIVGTKFGIEPPTYLQRAATAIGRRSGFFTGAAKALRGSGKVRFNAANARASLERSLRALGREEVEIFLLHEPDRMDLVNDDLLQFLEEARSAGKIGNYGIGGEYSLVTELYATRRHYTRVLQFEHSIFGPHLQVPEAFRIHYRTFAKPAAAFAERMEGDKGLCWWWSEMVGMDLREPSTQANLLLRAALDESPGAMTLFSASSEEHIYECAGSATNQALSEPAGRLRKLIIEDDLGIGNQLYGSHVKG
jgi:aryl-alcohol dehydrogenase-like predicted oxidoreductase